MTDINKLSIWEIVEIVSDMPDTEFGKFCQTNKFIHDVCYEGNLSESVFENRTRKFIDQKLIDFKEPGMSWQEFYRRIHRMNHPILFPSDTPLKTYIRSGGLMEVKILIAANPSVIQTGWQEIDLALQNDHQNIIKYFESLNNPLLNANFAARRDQNTMDWCAEANYIGYIKYGALLNPPIYPSQERINYLAQNPKYYKNILEFLSQQTPPLLPNSGAAKMALKDINISALEYLRSLNPPVLTK